MMFAFTVLQVIKKTIILHKVQRQSTVSLNSGHAVNVDNATTA